jgi:hypothetical protein
MNDLRASVRISIRPASSIRHRRSCLLTMRFESSACARPRRLLQNGIIGAGKLADD